MDKKKTNNQPVGKTDKPDSPVTLVEGNSDENCMCTYQGEIYGQGAEVCMKGTVHRCSCNGWFNTLKGC